MDIPSVINALESMKIIIQQSEVDLSWSSYKTEEDLIDDMDVCIYKLKHKDFSCLEKIKLLFAPTGDLQEISMSSGVAEEYLHLSEIIDENIK